MGGKDPRVLLHFTSPTLPDLSLCSSLQCHYLLLFFPRLLTGSIHTVMAIWPAGMPSNEIMEAICSRQGNAEKH